MPGYILHVGATVICLHGGQGQPGAPFPRVQVSGQPVVTQSSMHIIAGCGLTGTTSPPCVNGQWVFASVRVKAGSIPLLLLDSQAVCTPSGGKLNNVTTQLRVMGT